MRSAYRVAEIRRAEAHAGSDLMERAAFAIAARAADVLISLAGRVYGSSVLIVVGPGANGGDGLLAGAQLARRGAQVFALAVTERWHTQAMATFISAGGRVIDRSQVAPMHLVIDAIYGIGGRGPLDASLLTLFGSETDQPFVLSIDLPSGVEPDSGAISGAAVDADLTMATGALKAAHLIDPARHSCGVVELIDLDLPLGAPWISSWQGADIAALFDRLAISPITADKYRRGVLTLFAGSAMYPGAGALAARGALAMGVGMIRHHGPALLDEVPEIVMVDGQSDALAIGPGLTEADRDKARELLGRHLPAVVDAAAVTWVSSQKVDPLTTVITPHAGELARLLQVGRDEVERDRLTYLLQAVQRFNVTVVLKGSTTLIASPDGRISANPTGSIGLATAGSGDVLTGMIGALLARGCEAHEAAVAAVWLHGVAGSLAQAGASAVVEMLPRALAAISHTDDEGYFGS